MGKQPRHKSPRRHLLGLVFVSVVSLPTFASPQTSHLPTENERTSYYVAASSVADSVLLRRLADPAFDPFARQTIYVLRSRLAPHKENREIFQQFRAFINRQLATEQQDAREITSCLITVLNHVGYLGGDAGVNYLISLLETDDFTLSISSANFGKDYLAARHRLSSGAIQGLGNTTSPRAREFLVHIHKHPPKHFVIPLALVIRDAIIQIEEVTAMGFEAYASEEHQARIKARWEKRAQEIYEKAKKDAELRDKGGKP